MTIRLMNPRSPLPVIGQAQMSMIVASAYQTRESLVWWLQTSGGGGGGNMGQVLDTAGGTVGLNNHFGKQLISISEAEREHTHHPAAALLDKLLV